MNAIPFRATRRARGLFRRAGLGLVATLMVAGAPAIALAQAAPAIAAPAPSVPTTHILAIGSLTPRANEANLKAVLQSEVRDTVRLYLAGKLDQWFVKQDNTGVVFILNVTDVAEARAILEGLPLGKAGLMTFQLTPLGPLRPLGVLLAN